MSNATRVTISEAAYNVTVSGDNVTVAETGGTVTIATAGTQGAIGNVLAGSSNGDVLVWSTANSRWEPSSKSDAGIIVSVPTSGEYQIQALRLDGSLQIIVTHKDTAET